MFPPWTHAQGPRRTGDCRVAGRRLVWIRGWPRMTGDRWSKVVRRVEADGKLRLAMSIALFADARLEWLPMPRSQTEVSRSEGWAVRDVDRYHGANTQRPQLT